MAENAVGWGLCRATARQPDRPQSSSTAQWTHEEPGKEVLGPRAPQDPWFETSFSKKSRVDAGEPGEALVGPHSDHLLWCWKSAPRRSIALVNTWRNQFLSPSKNGAVGRLPGGAGQCQKWSLMSSVVCDSAERRSRLFVLAFRVRMAPLYYLANEWGNKFYSKRLQQHLQHNSALQRHFDEDSLQPVVVPEQFTARSN